MNSPKKSEIEKKVKELKQKAERILNDGVKNSLKETLESHAFIKILFEELEYTLSKDDISNEEILRKISSIEKELDEMEKER